MIPTGTKPFRVGDWMIEPDLLRISKNGEIRRLELRTIEILHSMHLGNRNLRMFPKK